MKLMYDPVMEISEQICNSLSSRGEKSDHSFTSTLQPPETVIKKKKKNSSKLENKRRFSEDQIRALEFMFESEEKLEGRKKLQIARELGLQPRQIAIWFQNRRARWKAKRTEQDYRKLKVDYDNLLSSFESLKEEKQSLQEQLLKLRDVMGGSEPREARRDEEVTRGSSEQEEDGRNVMRWEVGDRKVSCSSDQVEEKNGPFTLTDQKWCSAAVDPCGLFDQSAGANSQWLDFCTF